MPYAASVLPPALLELTLLRVSGATPRLTNTVGGALRWKRAFANGRATHQDLATAAQNSSTFQIMDSGFQADRISRRRNRKNVRSEVALTPKPSRPTPDTLSAHPIQELQKRVAALEETAESDETVPQSFFYNEEDLLAMYQDVLAIPTPDDIQSNDALAEAAVKKALAESEQQKDLFLLQQLEERLCVNEQGEREMEPSDIPAYRRILLRAQEIINRADAARRNANTDASEQSFRVPIGVLSPREYEALIRASMTAKDLETAQLALDIAKIAGIPMPEEVLTKILGMYSVAGNSQAADALLGDFLTETPTESQRDLHIQAHLNATPQTALPLSALNLLHQYEEQNSPAPMQTYTSVISSLYSRPMALARAHAWDIFSHMRYVAHPDPDVNLYTLMIKACASPVSVAYTSEPEKALDLWTEMTQDHKIPPKVASYNAVILACAKSGEKIYVNEAFRLARQMLDTNRDARGISAFRPDLETFCALLEGCKRIGDLGRARWILVEMVKGGQNDAANSIEVEINDEVMMHVFHAYASYKPPVIRPNLVSPSENKDPGAVSDVRTSSDNATQSEGAHASQTQKQQTSDQEMEMKITKEEPEDTSNTFSRLPPQSHAEVVREARMLMKSILADRSSKSASSPSSGTSETTRFRNVDISPRLLSAYLSVFYNHAPFEESRELFRTIFNELRVTPTPRLYVEALEKCGNARRGPERQLAVEFADELWQQWTVLEDDSRFSRKPLEARLVERAHVARIRTLAKAEQLSRAMIQLRAFAAKYPPEVIKNPPPKLPLHSTRTSLVGLRPLVRMTTPTEVPDDAVPPLIAFRDLEVLHHRLVFEERTKDIGYITWLCRSYEWALRIRKEKATTAKVQNNGITTAGPPTA